MRLNELKTLRDPNIQNILDANKANRPHAFANFLKSKGFERINQGAYSTVFTAKGLNYMIKLSDGRDNYPDFVTLAQTNPSRHFPQFRGKPMLVDKNCVVTRMEILYPVVGLVASNLDTLWEEVIPEIGQGSTKKDFLNQIKCVADSDNVFKAWVRENRSLLSSVFFVIDHCPNDLGVDLHANNYMQRSDGTIVIIDPYE